MVRRGDEKMKTFTLTAEATARICAEIADLIGQDSLTASQCKKEISALEEWASSEYVDGPTRFTCEAEISQYMTLSGRTELVSASYDDFIVTEVDEDEE